MLKIPYLVIVAVLFGSGFSWAAAEKLKPQASLYGVTPHDAQWCALKIQYTAKDFTTFNTIDQHDTRPGSRYCGSKDSKQDYFEIDFDSYYSNARRNPDKRFNANFLAAIEHLEKHFKVSYLYDLSKKISFYLRAPVEPQDKAACLMLADTQQTLLLVCGREGGNNVEFFINKML